MRVLVVGDRGDDAHGYVGERLVEHGAELSPLDRDALPAWPEAGPAGLLLLLGSIRSALDPDQESCIRAETALISAAVDAGVPVMGLCYGSQIAAQALGGKVVPAAHAEIGLFEVESADAVLCPPGPWVQFHSDSFEPPPDAVVVGRTTAGPQGFRLERGPARVIAWQFHPEATPDELGRWLVRNDAYVRAHGFDPAVVRRAAAVEGPGLRARAYVLTDTALGWLTK